MGLLACYRNVRTRFHSLLALVDPSVLPKNRRLNAVAFEREVERRLAATTEDELRVRYERLEWLIGTVIEASIRTLPRDLRRRWKGSVAVDGTPVAAWARPPRRARGDTNRVETHSADPDAGWYIRDPDQRDTDSPWLLAHDTPRDRRWVQEATFVVMSAERDGDHEYPFLIVGMAPLDRPGHNVGLNAIRALTNLRVRAHQPGFLTGDRAYSNSRPENYQLPAKAVRGHVKVLAGGQEKSSRW
jgi:hypothetical protein